MQLILCSAGRRIGILEAGLRGVPIQKQAEAMNDGIVITIVDDDESLRKAIKRLINAVGLGVEDFASAEDFMYSDRSPDAACLILDVQLPGMSGLELQRQLLTSDCRVPIIFISARGDGQARERALEAGAVDFLQKPFSEDALFNAINSALALNGRGVVGSSDQGDSV